MQGHLGKPLSTPHDVGRTYRFVGRNQYEAGHAGLQCSLSGIQRPHHIIEHAFGNIVLYHRYMLVSSSVINSIDMPAFHHIQQLLLIAHRPQDRHQSNRQRLARNALFKLTENAVKIEFAVVE
ncbi:hypothetical protein D3C79_781040 [compost metagenome]